MRYFFFSFLLCALLPLPAQAQWYNKIISRLAKKVSPVATSVERVTLQAQGQTQRAHQAVLKLVRHYDAHYGSLDDTFSSAFAIEENTQGVRRIWGVTVQHYALYHPAVWHPNAKRTFPVRLQAAGNRRYYDVVLFSLPNELSSQLTPLKLATTLPQPGERVNSYGYYNNRFQHLYNRLVKEVSPARLVTSYEFSTNQIGACGGPVLNAQDEVVGVHCGSLQNQDKSFVIPTSHILRLLESYDHYNKNKAPLLFNGHKIYELSVNEAVRNVIALRQGKEIEDIPLVPPDITLDPAHLENLLTTSEADQLILFIDRNNFSTNKPTGVLEVNYDIQQNKVISLREIH